MYSGRETLPYLDKTLPEAGKAPGWVARFPGLHEPVADRNRNAQVRDVPI